MLAQSLILLKVTHSLRLSTLSTPKSLLKRRGSSKKALGFSVDRSGLIGGGLNLDKKENNKNTNYVEKEVKTQLAKDLRSVIELRGPISMHEYSSQCANHAYFGYYRQDKEKIGEAGDFMTSPEISQVFGELVGLWCMSQWQALGQPNKVKLVEMGPGKGTLMDDILTISQKFPDFHKALDVHLVEQSEDLRGRQAGRLDCGDIGIDPAKAKLPLNDQEVLTTQAVQGKTKAGVPVQWHYALQQIEDEEDVPYIIIGQEFLDVFPVHQFVFQDGRWLEKLVDNEADHGSAYHFRTVLSQSSTPAVNALLGEQNSYGAQNGDTLEISPLALATCEDIASKVQHCKGSALLIDYGENYHSGDSLRGFRHHKLVDIFSMPGDTDITADVDFAACAVAATRRGAKVIGAIPQAEFLIRMGLVGRLEMLISAAAEEDQEKLVNILTSARLLVDENEMGKRFKCMLITHSEATEENYVGFPILN